jgi:hypothetical protein
MGYHMTQKDTHFHISVSNKVNALIAIQDIYYKDPNRKYSWIQKNYQLKNTLKEIMNDWRWNICQDLRENVNDIEFEGEKFGDDDVLFRAIGPFVQAGSWIEMLGEDGAYWRWVFDGKRVHEFNASNKWNDEDGIMEALGIPE